MHKTACVKKRSACFSFSQTACHLIGVEDTDKLILAARFDLTVQTGKAGRPMHSKKDAKQCE